MIKGLHRIHNNLFKLEAAKILPLCKNGMSKSTLLDIFATSFKFAHYNDFIDRRYDLLDINSFSTLDISKLFEIEKEIINRLKEAREDHITQISFIQDEINKRLKSFLEHPSFNVYEILAVSHFIHGGRPLINSDWELNEFAVKSFIYDYAARLDEIQEYSGYGKDSFFYDYKKFKSEEANHRSFTFNNKKTFIARGYHYATHINNLIKPITGDSILFNLAYELRNSEKTIDEVYKEIEDIISFERTYHTNNAMLFREDESFKIKLQYPSLHLEKHNKNKDYQNIIKSTELLISERSEETNPNLKGKAKKIRNYIDSCQNILHTGCVGSGLSETQLSVLYQEISSGKSAIYIQANSDTSIYSKVSSQAYSCNRSEDLIFLSFKNAEELLDYDLINYVMETNKILIINIPCFLRSEDEAYKKGNDLICSVFDYIEDYKEKEKNKDNSMNFNNKISVYLSEIDNYNIKVLNKIEYILNKEYSNDILFRLTAYSFYWKDKEREDATIRIIKNYIPNVFAMKAEEPHNILKYFENPSNLVDRDFKNLLPGEFYIINNNVIGDVKNKGFYYPSYFEYNINHLRVVPPYYGKR